MCRSNCYISDCLFLFVEDCKKFSKNPVGDFFNILCILCGIFKPHGKVTACCQSLNVKVRKSVFLLEAGSLCFRKFTYAVKGTLDEFFFNCKRLDVRFNNKAIVYERVLCTLNNCLLFIIIPTHCYLESGIEFLAVVDEFFKLSLCFVSTGILDCAE